MARLMNFIETLFESINKSIHQYDGDIPYDIQNYVIGSGSNFEVHENISMQQAERLYEKYIQKLPLGKKRSAKQVGTTILESWHTLESNTGITYTFMFKINKIIKHDPNEVIDEWNARTGNLKRITKNETK